MPQLIAGYALIAAHTQGDSCMPHKMIDCLAVHSLSAALWHCAAAGSTLSLTLGQRQATHPFLPLHASSLMASSAIR